MHISSTHVSGCMSMHMLIHMSIRAAFSDLSDKANDSFRDGFGWGDIGDCCTDKWPIGIPLHLPLLGCIDYSIYDKVLKRVLRIRDPNINCKKQL